MRPASLVALLDIHTQEFKNLGESTVGGGIEDSVAGGQVMSQQNLSHRRV